MTADYQHVRLLGELFDGHSDERIRAMGVDALRSWCAEVKKRGGQPISFNIHGDLAKHLLPLLYAEKPKFKGDHTKLKEAFLFSPNSWGEPMNLVTFLRWLDRAGLAIPLGAEANQYPITYRLTSRGSAFLQSSEDHPLLPGHVERLRQRCLGLPDDAVAMLSDSHACLERGLLRPAVAVMGVAYEVAVEAIVTALVARSLVPATTNEQNSARRIAAVKGTLNTIFVGRTPTETDRRFAAHAAYDFAEALRRRRNDASHTAPR